MLRWLVVALVLVVTASAATDARSENDFASQRTDMVEDIKTRAMAMGPITGIPRIDGGVLEVMEEVPRHLFVPEPLRPYAYYPTPLPLGFGQNMASPYIVALMTHLAEVRPDDRVLETGTSGGYQAAILSHLADEVVSVEVIPEIANEARVNLVEAGYGRVRTYIADGYYGWSERAPYDVILLKDSLDHVPEPLLRQLAPGGRMVMPLGPEEEGQELTVITKNSEGEVNRRAVLPVLFSPLRGGDRI